MENVYTSFALIWDKLGWKKLLLVTSKMLGLFANVFPADDKYSRDNKENFLQQIQIILSQKPKTFLDFPLPLWNLHQILSIFKIKMSLMA